VNDDVGRRCCVSAHSPNLHCSMLLCFTLLAMHVKEEIAALRYRTPNIANTQILFLPPSVRSTALHLLCRRLPLTASRILFWRSLARRASLRVGRNTRAGDDDLDRRFAVFAAATACRRERLLRVLERVSA
jgi:hypothetical protein